MTISSIPADQRHFSDVQTSLFPGSLRSAHNGRICYATLVSGSTLVAEFMKFVGVEVVFGIPGGNSLALNDALTHAHVDGAFRYVLTGHEQGAAFEAEGYAAASGKVGFCTATSGPGATNLITGLADAFRDSRPVMAFTGNAATTAEPETFQALDIVGITDGRATKASFRPQCPADVQEILVRGYHLAVTGRPGSILIDLPKDVQTGLVLMRPWEQIIDGFDWSRREAVDEDVRAVARMFVEAERPVLYVGHGVVLSNAAEEIRRLSHEYQIPVITTVHAIGVLEADDPLNLGMIGMHGTVVANLAVHRSDLAVALGARFDDRTVSAHPDRFAPHARVVHIDVDRYQLNRVRPVDLAIWGDVKPVLQQILDELGRIGGQPDRHGRRAWLDEVQTIRERLPLASNDRPNSPYLSHEFIYATIAEALRRRDQRDVVATFDVGTHQMKGAQWFPISQPRSFITSGGMGSMGCAIPMAVGAAQARPEALVIAAVGDGGFVMSLHELDTIGGYGIPVKIVLFDDAHLGMVTNWHSLFYQGRKLTSDRRRDRPVEPVDVEGMKQQLQRRLDDVASEDDLVNVVCRAAECLAASEWPLFALIGSSYGIPAERVHLKEQLPAAVERMLETAGPYLLHIEIQDQCQVYPLVAPGTTPQDLIWRETEPGSGQVVHVRDVYDFATGEFRNL